MTVFLELPIGANLWWFVGPNSEIKGIPLLAIKWPQPVSFAIPNLQSFEIFIVFKGLLVSTILSPGKCFFFNIV